MTTQSALGLVHPKTPLDPAVLKIGDTSPSGFCPQPPKYKWIEAQRTIGYTIKTAIAEHIDNSIDAQATEVHIELLGELRSNIEKIVVMDNGFGMNFDILLNSFQFGATRQRRTYECGKFGQGGIVGSLSFAAEKETWTRDKDSGTFTGRAYNLEVCKKRDCWGTLELKSDEESAVYKNLFEEKFGNSTGTILVHKKLDKLTNYQSYGIKRQLLLFLGEAFCQFILSNSLKIFVDGEQVKAIDPLHWDDPDVMKLVDEVVTLKDGRSFRVKVADMINIHSREGIGSCGYRGRTSAYSQGLYFFRSNRLIKGPLLNDDGINGLEKTHATYTQFVRIAVEFNADMDHEMGVSAQKNDIEVKRENNVQASITSLINPVYPLAITRYKSRKNNKSSAQRQQLLNRASKVFNSATVRPKKKKNESGINRNRSGGSAANNSKLAKQYIIIEQEYGKHNSCFALKGNTIIINTESSFVEKYYMNADQDAQEGFLIDNLADLAAQAEMGDDTETLSYDQFVDVFIPSRNIKRIALLNQLS